MKKIVFFLVFISFLLILRAQDTIYPFEQGQTLEHDTVTNISEMGPYGASHSSLISLTPIHLQHQLVTGLAIPFIYQEGLYHTNQGAPVTLWGVIAEVHGNDYLHPTFHLTRPWTLYDVETYTHLNPVFNQYDINIGLRYTTDCPVQKVDTVLGAKLFYFDEPLLLNDTVWVSVIASDTVNHEDLPARVFTFFQCITPQFGSPGTIPGIYYSGIRNPTLIAKFDSGAMYHIIIPISTVPDTDTFGCPEVEGFGFAGMNAGSPTFVWDTAAEHEVHQVAYGPYDAPLESLRIAETNASFLELFDNSLRPDIYYQARVRARCHHRCPIHDTVMWTAWSAPVYFYTGDHMPDTTHQPEGIDAPGETLPFAIVPNPSRSGERQVVEIGRQVPLQGLTLTLHDAAGHEVLRMEVKEHRFALPASLPAGVYVATLASPQGTAVRRVVVES